MGAHAKHIEHIKTSLGGLVLNPAADTFGAGSKSDKVCGTCHTIAASNHMTGTRLINFRDGSYLSGGVGGFSLVFGSSNPVYNGVVGTSSSVNPKTCSNISCHFQTTPVWSAY